jgi:hypothetical protein
LYFFSLNSFIVFSSVYLISSFNNKDQAWHVDTPIPNVYVNILTLDEGQHRTQLMRCAVPEYPLKDLKPPIEEKFDPSDLSDNWKIYLRKK